MRREPGENTCWGEAARPETRRLVLCTPGERGRQVPVAEDLNDNEWLLPHVEATLPDLERGLVSSPR